MSWGMPSLLYCCLSGVNMENRSAYKNQVINLELYTNEIPAGVVNPVISRVLIMQDKEICFVSTNITQFTEGWRVTVDTSKVLYTGAYSDWWVLSNGTVIEKNLKLTSALTPEIDRSVSDSSFYYSKDLAYIKKSDGDLFKIYDEESVMSKIKSVIMTIKGSLYYEPYHGTNLYRYLFSMSSTVAFDMQNEVYEQLSKQIPQIQVHNVLVEEVTKGYYCITVYFYNLASAAPQELLSTENMSLVVSTADVIS